MLATGMLSLILSALPPADAPARPLVVLSGAESHVAKASYRRVGNETHWNKLWLSHLGKADGDQFRERLPAVEVDFVNCVVVAIFRGPRTNTRGVQIISVAEEADRVVVRFDDLTYQTAGPIGGGPAPVNRSTPYAFVVLPKTDKDIVVEEDTQGLKDQPPAWKERARLTLADATTPKDPPPG